MKSTIAKISNVINDLIVIKPDSFFDFRGENVETYNQNDYSLMLKSIDKFKQNDIKFVIDSYSFSSKNVLRGFHGDLDNWKLVDVIKGNVYFVVIDIRSNSSTYKNVEYFQLNDKNRLQILVPAGCVNAHLVTSDECIFHYKLTESYVDIEKQIHVKWNDSTYNIFWPISNPILSKRDL
jgi:dTDP-4-dehydrorhamnose 3,5-epimerase